MKRIFLDDANTFLSDLRGDVSTTPIVKHTLTEVRNEIDRVLRRFGPTIWTDLPSELVGMTFLTQRSGACLCKRFFRLYIEQRVRRLVVPVNELKIFSNLSFLPQYPVSVEVTLELEPGWTLLPLISFLTERRLWNCFDDFTPLYVPDVHSYCFSEIHGLRSTIKIDCANFFTPCKKWYGVARIIWKVHDIRDAKFVECQFPDLRTIVIHCNQYFPRLRNFTSFADVLCGIWKHQNCKIQLPKQLYVKLRLPRWVRSKCDFY